MLTLKEATNFLTKHYSDEVTDVLAINHGDWSKAFSFNYQNKALVIRFNKNDDSFLNDQFAYENFSSDLLPIPKILEIGKFEDGFFAISEKADGIFIDTLKTEEFKRILPALLNLFETMKKADLTTSKGFGNWDKNGNGTSESWQEFLLNVENDNHYNWKDKLANSKYGLGTFNKFFSLLKDNIQFCPNERYLVHSDLLYFNLLVSNDQISSVLDWGCAKYGDFLYDLVWYDFWSKWYPEIKDIDFVGEYKKHFDIREEDIPNFKQRILCYKLHMALDSIVYSTYKDNWKHLESVIKYVEEKFLF